MEQNQKKKDGHPLDQYLISILGRDQIDSQRSIDQSTVETAGARAYSKVQVEASIEMQKTPSLDSKTCLKGF